MASKELIEKELATNLKRGADLMQLCWAIMEERLAPIRALLRVKEASNAE